MVWNFLTVGCGDFKEAFHINLATTCSFSQLMCLGEMWNRRTCINAIKRLISYFAVLQSFLKLNLELLEAIDIYNHNVVTWSDGFTYHTCIHLIMPHRCVVFDHHLATVAH